MGMIYRAHYVFERSLTMSFLRRQESKVAQVDPSRVYPRGGQGWGDIELSGFKCPYELAR